MPVVGAGGLAGVDLPARLLPAYRAALRAQAVLYADVLDVLGNLRRQGLRLALLTDNPPASQRAKIAAAPGLLQIYPLRG